VVWISEKALSCCDSASTLSHRRQKQGRVVPPRPELIDSVKNVSIKPLSEIAWMFVHHASAPHGNREQATPDRSIYRLPLGDQKQTEFWDPQGFWLALRCGR
jgi:hypothetical protein